MSPPLLQVRDLRVELPGGALAVDGVDFDLPAGGQLALVGESGSGKSLTVAALLGLLPRGARASARELRWDGRELLPMSPRARRALRGREIALVPQQAGEALNPVRRIGAQLVAVLRRVQGLDAAAARERALHALAQLGLPDPQTCLQAYPHELSGGQRQRVLLALALACRPRLLVADEATSALDAVTQAQTLRALREHARAAGSALLLITHDLAVAAEACERLAVMYAGQVIEYGSTAALLRAPQHPYTTALLDARPAAHRTGTRLPVLPGSPARPQARTAGCAFEPRCRARLAHCGHRDPPLTVLADRALRCHLATPS